MIKHIDQGTLNVLVGGSALLAAGAYLVGVALGSVGFMRIADIAAGAFFVNAVIGGIAIGIAGDTKK